MYLRVPERISFVEKVIFLQNLEEYPVENWIEQIELFSESDKSTRKLWKSEYIIYSESCEHSSVPTE